MEPDSLSDWIHLGSLGGPGGLGCLGGLRYLIWLRETEIEDFPVGFLEGLRCLWESETVGFLVDFLAGFPEGMGSPQV